MLKFNIYVYNKICISTYVYNKNYMEKQNKFLKTPQNSVI